MNSTWSKVKLICVKIAFPRRFVFPLVPPWCTPLVWRSHCQRYVHLNSSSFSNFENSNICSRQVRLFVQMNRTDGGTGDVKLMTNFPKKVLCQNADFYWFWWITGFWRWGLWQHLGKLGSCSFCSFDSHKVVSIFWAGCRFLFALSSSEESALVMIDPFLLPALIWSKSHLWP